MKEETEERLIKVMEAFAAKMERENADYEVFPRVPSPDHPSIPLANAVERRASRLSNEAARFYAKERSAPPSNIDLLHEIRILKIEYEALMASLGDLAGK